MADLPSVWHLCPDLGEIVRNILLHLIDNLFLFNGHSSPILNTHYGFDAAFVSAVEGSKSDSEVKSHIYRELNIPEDLVKEQDIELVKWACRAVSTRAAALAACAVAAVVLHTKSLDRPETIDVGMDGSVAEFLPHFEERLRAALRQTIGDDAEKRIQIGLAKDGSGVGGMSISIEEFQKMRLIQCSRISITAALCALQAKKAEKKGIHPEVKKMDPVVPSPAESK